VDVGYCVTPDEAAAEGDCVSSQIFGGIVQDLTPMMKGYSLRLARGKTIFKTRHVDYFIPRNPS
jgi:hypothetical protein